MDAPAPIVIRGRKWHPRELSICMGYDALRLAIGGKPKNFTPSEIILWLKYVGKEE